MGSKARRRPFCWSCTPRDGVPGARCPHGNSFPSDLQRAGIDARLRELEDAETLRRQPINVEEPTPLQAIELVEQLLDLATYPDIDLGSPDDDNELRLDAAHKLVSRWTLADLATAKLRKELGLPRRRRSAQEDPMIVLPEVEAEIRAAIPEARWTCDPFARTGGTVYVGSGAQWRFLVVDFGDRAAGSATPFANGGAPVHLTSELAAEAVAHARKHPFTPNPHR